MDPHHLHAGPATPVALISSGVIMLAQATASGAHSELDRYINLGATGVCLMVLVWLIRWHIPSVHDKARDERVAAAAAAAQERKNLEDQHRADQTRWLEMLERIRTQYDERAAKRDEAYRQELSKLSTAIEHLAAASNVRTTAG